MDALERMKVLAMEDSSCVKKRDTERCAEWSSYCKLGCPWSVTCVLTPKSHSFTAPLVLTRMLDGLISVFRQA